YFFKLNRLHLHQAAQDYRGTALSRDRVRVELSVTDKFTLGILVREAPEIRRVDAFTAVTKAVEAFQLEADASEGRLEIHGHFVEGQRIDCTLLESERR